MINGQQIGSVKISDDVYSFRYHTIIKSKIEGNIYQGFGMTLNEALRDSIIKNRSIRNEELLELDRLENVIWGDSEIY